MRDFAILGKRKAVLGMIHLQPLPGTPFYKDGSFNQTLDRGVCGNLPGTRRLGRTN